MFVCNGSRYDAEFQGPLGDPDYRVTILQKHMGQELLSEFSELSQSQQSDNENQA